MHHALGYAHSAFGLLGTHAGAGTVGRSPIAAG